MTDSAGAHICPRGTLVAIFPGAANLRAEITGVGPLLPTIEKGAGNSSAWRGILSTLPLLTFAAVSPLRWPRYCPIGRLRVFS